MSVLFTALKKRFSKNQLASVCKHPILKSEIIIDRIVYSLQAKPQYCIPCLRQKSTHCAWCGKEIVLGRKISLQPSCPGRAALPQSQVYSDDNIKNHFVGCLRESCVRNHSVWVGTWTDPGEVTDVYRAIIACYEP